MTLDYLDVSPRRQKLAPRASVLIESMRDIGYSLQTAVSDVVDNSITAGARNIQFLANTTNDIPAIGILDDGAGMLMAELLEAMRPGSQSPLEERAEADLGRFGLGLKTASFSQCRRLTVLTRKDGVMSCAVWDLDLIAETDDWFVELPINFEGVPWSDKLEADGTLVVWQKLDRLIDPRNETDNKLLVQKVDETATHLELVFHRFLMGEQGIQKISIFLNGRRLAPYDPFHSRHPATTFGPEEVFRLGKHDMRIQAVTLPHHKKVTAEEWSHYAGQEGYIKNQGFYLYRQKRLIIHGTWFNLARQTELTKLARVRIDIPNGMDSDWKIDVKKASAQPPAPVRDRLRRIIEAIGAGSKRVYTTRGQRLITDDRLPVWTRSQNKNEISYGLNLAHPSFDQFSKTLSDSQRSEFRRLLDLIESTIPIDTLFSDISAHPESVATKALDSETLKSLVTEAFMILKSGDRSYDEVKNMMYSAEPFRSAWAIAEPMIDAIEDRY